MKKILLLGEYSGLHTNLKEGLIELGYEVHLASSGDGKKQILGDFDISLKKSSNKILKFLELKKILQSFQGYDIVQFINPYVSHKVGALLYNDIFEKNERCYCVGAGDDVEFIRFVKNGGMGKYSPFDSEIQEKKELPFDKPFDKYIHNRFMKKINGVIPIVYEYAESYRSSKYRNKLKQTIAMPINCNEIQYKDNIVKNDKVVIYHGVTRPTFKGSKYIIEAMDYVQRKYPNDVEVIHAKTLPLEEYLKVIDRANIIMDQCRSYSYAMNALYSMAMGKVVMSGAEPECNLELNTENNPVVNIQPDTQQIVRELEKIIERKNEIKDIGYNSRQYVEKYHSHIKIANQYVKQWN